MGHRYWSHFSPNMAQHKKVTKGHVTQVEEAAWSVVRKLPCGVSDQANASQLREIWYIGKAILTFHIHIHT